MNFFFIAEIFALVILLIYVDLKAKFKNNLLKVFVFLLELTDKSKATGADPTNCRWQNNR